MLTSKLNSSSKHMSTTIQCALAELSEEPPATVHYEGDSDNTDASSGPNLGGDREEALALSRNDLAGHLDHRAVTSGDDNSSVAVYPNGGGEQTSAMGHLSRERWVGDHFVFFLDIPWADNLGDQLQIQIPTCRSDDSRPNNLMRDLTFGLLEKVMRTKIADNDYLLQREEERIISGDKLLRLIVAWAHHLYSRAQLLDDAPTFHEWGGEVRTHLVAVISSVDQALYPANGALLALPPAPDVICGLGTFFRSLSQCVAAIWPHEQQAFHELNNCTKTYGRVTDILRDKLRESWDARMAYQIERLLVGNIEFTAYASTCQPTVNRVGTVNTQGKDYVPQHVVPGCNCSFVKPSIDTVRALLLKNELPVVVFDGSGLIVRPASDGPYLAISHVWADGAGGSSEVGLPHCQVKRLSELAHELVPGGAFWQDGLCVPLGPVEVKRKAIGLLKVTYMDAARVLVIDAGIRTQCSTSSPPEECLLRIATSGWMQRIWTLQEGMLARELLFEVRDRKTIDCTHFNGDPAYLTCILTPFLRYRRADNFAREFQQTLSETPTCNVKELIPLLRHRGVSFPEDEPIAISGLLGLDASELVIVEDAEERMKALFLAVKKLPRVLALRGWACPRLAIRNFSWAPATLSKVLWSGGGDDDYQKATCTEDGLFGDFTVVSFPEVTIWGQSTGVIASIKEDMMHTSLYIREHARADSAEARLVFNLVVPSFACEFTFNGFLMMENHIGDSWQELAVGVVYVEPDEDLQASPGSSIPRCKFVAPGSVRWGKPYETDTNRLRDNYEHVEVSEVEVCRPVRVT